MREAILEPASGPGEYNFVTIVEWENSEAIEGARRAAAALHQKMNFAAQAMSNRLENPRRHRELQTRRTGNGW